MAAPDQSEVGIAPCEGDQMNAPFSPILELEGIQFPSSGATPGQFGGPRIKKTFLKLCYESRLLHGEQTGDAKRLHHSWLLELGVGAIADCQQAAALYLNPEKNQEYPYALRMLRTLQP